MAVPQTLLVFACALLPRALLSILHPATAGDASVYRAVALNILNNGCVSLSEPAAAACIPHWGGNHFPGFPAFVALVWSVTDDTWLPIALAHSLIFALATAYLYLALRRSVPSSKVALAAAIVLALSPLTVPWARFTLPETLALAIVVWVTAELCLSLALGRLRLLPLGAAMTIGLFIRYDLVLLALPIALVGLLIHPFWQAVRRGLMLMLIIAIPIGAWWARSVSAGLGIAPPVYFLANGFATPTGYLDWVKTWATNQYQAPQWWYPIHFAAYGDIIIEADAYISIQERTAVEDLLRRLRQYEDKPFPADIDRKFAELAQQRRAEAPVRYWLWLPIQRIARLWVNPLNSAGWPVAIGWTGGSVNMDTVVAFLLEHPWPAMVKGLSAAYRLGLIVVGVVLMIPLLRHKATLPSIMLSAALLHAVARTGFLGWAFFIESRYLLEAIPLLEVAIVLAGTEIWQRRSERMRGKLTRHALGAEVAESPTFPSR